MGALHERDDTVKVLKALADPDIVTVVQVAPAVRAAWAEDFGLPLDVATPGRMVSALKALGFDYVYDTNFSADLTIMEEASEFIERFTPPRSVSLAACSPPAALVGAVCEEPVPPVHRQSLHGQVSSADVRR